MEEGRERDRLCNGARGAVAMEYAVLLGVFGVALFSFAHREFFSPGAGFGPLGRGIAAFYERTLGGLSLPVP